MSRNVSRSHVRLKPAMPASVLATPLSERQAMVLRALIAAYVGQAGPVSSGRLAELVRAPLSSASIRNTLSELDALGLIEKAHASSGRVPTSFGMSVYVDHLMALDDLGPHEQRMIERVMRNVDSSQTPRQASQLLSEYTRQLGFVMAPRVEHLRLQTVHLVPVAEQRVLAVLVTEQGGVLQRVIDSPERLDARALERVGALLAERVAGCTLTQLRRRLEEERDRLRGEADEWMRRVWWVGLEACDQEVAEDLVIGTRLSLLGQPEFSDPERIRGLFTALEANQGLLDLLREIGSADQTRQDQSVQVGLAMNLGRELGEPSLEDCALVAVSYGRRLSEQDARSDVAHLSNAGRLPGSDRDRLIATSESEEAHSGAARFADEACGVLGVIGPQRMDYARVIPMVSYCADLVTRKLIA